MAERPQLDRLGTLIRERRRVLGWTLETVAQACACGRSYLSQIENGKRDRPPSRAILEKLETVLGFTDGELIRFGDWASTPPDVREHVADLERERLAARELVAALRARGVDALHESGDLERLVRTVEGRDGTESGDRIEMLSPLPMRVPVINKVAAGYPTEFTDLDYPARVADSYVSVPSLYDENAFAARVWGDSMEPRYSEGDIVVFSPDAPTKPGSDCFVRFERDAETTFKRIFFERNDNNDEVIRLQPLNAAYPPKTVPREAIAGLYAAVYVIRAV